MASCFMTATGPSSPFARSDTVTTTDPVTGATSTVPRTDFTPCDYVVWSGADYVTTVKQYNLVMAEPFNPATAGEFFAYGLVSTLGVWGLAYSVGRLLALIGKA